MDVSIKSIKRWFKYFWQRQIRGFDDTELWSLDFTVARFVLPRLIAFKNNDDKGLMGHPCHITMDEWNGILDDMIYAMEISANDFMSYEDELTVDWKRVEKGHLLFGSYFRDLWD